MGEGHAAIRVGLIGLGRSGTVIHAPLIEAVEGYRIAAVASSRPDVAAARRDAPQVFADPYRMIREAAIDMVVIASPNATHVPLAQAAIAAGRHVVIDKPFALDAGEAEGLFAAAARQGRLIAAFQNRRWDGDFHAIRAAIAGRAVGDLLVLEAHWDRFRPVAPTAWRNSDAPGAGVLWDLGVHMVDQALSLFGPPDSVSADVAKQRDGAMADDYFQLILRYGPLRCILSAASVVASPRPRFALHGTGGSMELLGLDPTEDALIAGRSPGDPDFRSALPPIPARWADAAGTSRTGNVAPGDWTGFYRGFRDAVRGEGPVPVDARTTIETIRLIERAHAQAAG